MNILNNGAVVIAQEGEIVLCKFRHDFVTWRVKNNEAYNGHYYGDDILEAAEGFKSRSAESKVRYMEELGVI